MGSFLGGNVENCQTITLGVQGGGSEIAPLPVYTKSKV